MTVVSVDTFGQDDPLKVPGHERLSDLGTHTAIQNILSSGFLPKQPSEYATPRIQVPVTDVATALFPALKAAGLRRAQEIADRARNRAEEPHCGWPTATLAAVFAEVLFDPQIRRGSVPPHQGRLDREKTFAAALHRTEPLRLAVLLFPVRDRNPAKNDGPSPDLGEVDALVQLWTITKALECARDTFIRERLEVAQRALGSSLQSHNLLYDSLAKVIEQHVPATPVDPCETTQLAIRIARQKKERITSRLLALGEELTAYTIHDREKAAALLLELARTNRSISWLFQGREIQAEQPISILAIRDARRYPCFSSEPESDIKHYKDVLDQLHRLLELGESVILTSPEELEAHCNPLTLDSFHLFRETVYREKRESYLRTFDPIRTCLTEASSREALLLLLSSVDTSGKIAPLFEAILHSKYHEPLVAWCSQFGPDAPQHLLHFLATIYERRHDSMLEALRQQLLWDTLVGAVEYVASYESNSLGGNFLDLDDVEFLAPGSVRLSIHQKPAESEHFAVQVGASVHRTPWHGTAFVRKDSRGKGYVLESKLALELKYENAIPVFLDQKLIEYDNLSLSSAEEGHHATPPPEETLTWLRKQDHEQPFFWLEQSIAKTLLNGENLDSRALIDDLIAKGIRRS